MTIREQLEKHLTDSGLFETQAKAVIDALIADDELTGSVMKDRWHEDVSLYPPQMLAVLTQSANAKALEWIDANKPQHWARGMFV